MIGLLTFALFGLAAASSRPRDPRRVQPRAANTTAISSDDSCGGTNTTLLIRWSATNTTCGCNSTLLMPSAPKPLNVTSCTLANNASHTTNICGAPAGVPQCLTACASGYGLQNNVCRLLSSASISVPVISSTASASNSSSVSTSTRTKTATATDVTTVYVTDNSSPTTTTQTGQTMSGQTTQAGQTTTPVVAPTVTQAPQQTSYDFGGGSGGDSGFTSIDLGGDSVDSGDSGFTTDLGLSSFDFGSPTTSFDFGSPSSATDFTYPTSYVTGAARRIRAAAPMALAAIGAIIAL